MKREKRIEERRRGRGKEGERKKWRREGEKEDRRAKF